MSKKERRSRINGVMDAVNNPQEAQGIEGVFARFFRLLSGDVISAGDIDPSQLHLRARKLAGGNGKPELQSSIPASVL